jgi:ketosteroid isomerase-like protein
MIHALLTLLLSPAWSAAPKLSPTEEVNAVVDAWHLAAEKSDEERYFSFFTDDAVFLGTDATERWPVAEFRKYTHDRFQKGTAWTIRAKVRRVSFSPDGKVAWFDEEVENKRWGVSRGSGVLVRLGRQWKIAQYNYCVPIPNDLLVKVVELIRAPKAPK